MAEDPTRRIARAREDYDRAYNALVAAIREDLEARVVSVTEAARQAAWSRQYIGEIRAGAAGDNPPRHRAARGGPGRRRSQAPARRTGTGGGDQPGDQPGSGGR
jgi:hypothetical protein